MIGFSDVERTSDGVERVRISTHPSRAGCTIERIIKPTRGYQGWDQWRIVDRRNHLGKYAPKYAGFFPTLDAAKAAAILLFST